MIDISTVKKHVEQYLNDTRDARFLSERDRDYRDHKQWTEKQINKLKLRGQAPVVINRIKPKIEGLLGLYNMRQSDPKAYPRTQKHEDASHAITDALRFVADNNDFDTIKVECADDFWVEGTCGGIVDVRQKKDGDIEVRMKRIPWDRLYYDPHSREKDFSDCRYKGMMLWLNEDQVSEMFPKAKVEELYADNTTSTDQTFEDRPRWNDRERNRIRVAYHFFMHKGEWHYCIFSGEQFLVKPQVSPFLDDEGQPDCIIELASCNVDRDNMRFGEVRGYIDQQDEINHRRSKFLHLLSQRQTKARTGSIDVEKTKKELAKPDGHIEIDGDSTDFEILNTGDMAQGQVTLYQDAKAELDAVGFNAQLAGERQQGDLSGKAIGKLQQAGTLELNRQFSILNNFEKRMYRQAWARIKQFWNEEKWIRITDDRDNLRWVGLNTGITAKEFLEEIINDESADLQKRRQAAASFQFLMQAAQNPDPGVAQQAQAKLEEIVEVKNDTSELDVDIIIDQSYEVINAEQEQFDMLVQFGQKGGIDIIELIEVSQIRNKDELVEKIEKRRAQAAEAAGNVAAKEAQAIDVKNAKSFADAQLTEQKARQTAIENQLLLNNPERVTNVSV